MPKNPPPRTPISPAHGTPQVDVHIGAKIQYAMGLHRAGQLAHAEPLYREILARLPFNFPVLYCLGLLQHQKGQYELAVEFFERAIRVDSNQFAAHLNLGLALHKLQRPKEALASFDRVIALKPDLAEAFFHRGLALQDLEQLEDALASYDHALALRPDFSGVLYNRGNVLRDLDRPEEALASYDRALALAPNSADVLSNRGIALQNLKRLEEALASYDRALALKPDLGGALHNRGTALEELGRLEEALASYFRVLELRPNAVETLRASAVVLQKLKRYEEATQFFARTLELAPDDPFTRGGLLLAKMSCCDWDDFASTKESIERDIHAGKQSAVPFGHLAISDSSQDLHACTQIYAAETFPPSKPQFWAGERYNNPKIRIGYLSGEFRNQATSILMAGLFERHDKSRFELFAFDNGWDDASEIRERINKAFDEIVSISRLRDIDAAATIREKQIDILVNLNGYFGLGRQGVFSHRPCPIQVNYLGFPGTLGVDYIDYIIADSHVIPSHHANSYAEKVVYLPDTYQVNDSERRIAEQLPSRADVGLPESGFVFCCFNNNYKTTPDIYDIWMRLLKNVPGSVLWLLEDNAAASRNLRREAERRGVSAESVVFAQRIELSKHLSRHRLADLFLDTLPCNAHTTASDALWAGLPVLTCVGGTFAGRVGGSLLNAVGMPELITHSLEDYEALALRLAATPSMLSDIRDRLARNRTTHPLFDTDRLRRNLESAYIAMWERHQRGEPPESFAVHATRRTA